MKLSFALCAIVALAAGSAQANNMGYFSLNSTAASSVTKSWSMVSDLTGFHFMSQDLNLGAPANSFYSLSGATIPAGGDVAAFTYYVASSGSATTHADIGSKLTPDSYSALTSADPDIGFGSVNFYFIHHKGTTDYFSYLVPGSATASSIADLKPMSGPGGPATVTAVSGYFALTFAGANLGYGANQFYYLKTANGRTFFGNLAPALLATSTDLYNYSSTSYTALVFVGTDQGHGVNMMYYLRLDSVTGTTIFGTLNPTNGAVADVTNLGSVLNAITFVSTDVGFGINKFYVTGPIGVNVQTVTFATIADQSIAGGAFTVTPTASSGLAVTLTLVSGSTGNVTISGPVSGVFTVTPTTVGLVTLQATQAGATTPTAYASTYVRRSFTITATPAPSTTTSPGQLANSSGTTTRASTTAAITATAPMNVTNATTTTTTLSTTTKKPSAAGGYAVALAMTLAASLFLAA